MKRTPYYDMEDSLYSDWVQEQGAALAGDPDAAEQVAFLLYDAIRLNNREAERVHLLAMPLGDLKQAYVDHCADLPVDPRTAEWNSNGPARARWWDQGKLILSVAHDRGLDITLDTTLPLPLVVIP